MRPALKRVNQAFSVFNVDAVCPETSQSSVVRDGKTRTAVFRCNEACLLTALEEGRWRGRRNRARSPMAGSWMYVQYSMLLLVWMRIRTLELDVQNFTTATRGQLHKINVTSFSICRMPPAVCDERIECLYAYALGFRVGPFLRKYTYHHREITRSRQRPNRKRCVQVFSVRPCWVLVVFESVYA